MSPFTPESAYGFLLGELGENDAQRLETRLLQDDDAYEALKAYEADLIDDYVGDALTPERRLRFETRYMQDSAQRQRVAFAQALLERARAAHDEQPGRRAPAADRAPAAAWIRESWFGSWFGPRFAIGAVAAALAVAVLLPVSPERRTLTISLAPAAVRAGGEVAVVRVPDAPGWLDVELALDDTPAASPGWLARLQKDGRMVWSSAPARRTDVAVWVRIPFASLTEGRHTIELSRGETDAQTFVAAYPLEVSKSGP